MSRSSSSTSSQRRVKERNVPKTGAFDALLYFSGRDPRRVKALRAVYSDDVDDSVSVRSGSSMWSMWSASSQNNVQYYFVEPRGYWAEPQEYEPARKTKSGASGRSQGPQPNPTAAWARNATVHNVSDDSDSDDGSDTSLDQYGPQGGPGPGPAPGPGPFMRPPGMAMPPRGPPNVHPHMGGPPAGFPPQYGMGPRPSPHPQMGQPGPGMPPPPPHAFPRGPPPPGPGGQFVAGVRGFQG